MSIPPIFGAIKINTQLLRYWEPKKIKYSTPVFEEATSGVSSLGDAHTGKQSKVGGYNHTLSNVPNGSYVLRYWQKSGNDWTLTSQAVTVSSGSYTINVSGQVDDIRFLPIRCPNDDLYL